MDASPNKRGLAALIISKGRPQGAEPAAEGPEEGSSSAEMLHCASAMIEAIHAKDAGAFNDALRNWFQHAEMQEPEDEGGDEPEDNDSRGY